MSIASPPKLVSFEEFSAIPPDEMDRELIRGEIRERPMTKRNRFHAATEATVARLVGNWAVSQTAPRGRVYSGEVGCILRRDPDTNVGIDVAYFSADTIARQDDRTTMIEGAPVLAVEILSPSDVQKEIAEKVSVYLESDVAVVWVVDTHFKTVTIHRLDTAPRLVNIEQRLAGDTDLPGLDIAVVELFS